MRKSLCVLLAMVLAVSAFSGCTVQQNPDADDGKLHVVTTIFAPYDFARQVGGDDVSVTMLLRPGCEVHSYEPTPKDIIAIRNADVFVYVGGESDAWVKTVLEGVDNPNLRVVTLMDCVELLDEVNLRRSVLSRIGREMETRIALRMKGQARVEFIMFTGKYGVLAESAGARALCERLKLQ